MSEFYQFKVLKNNKEELNLSELKNKVVLIVNTASKCGFTNQYSELQELHTKYSSRNLVVLGFPCNQFGTQEPGDNKEIQEFCTLNFGVSFPIMNKIEVNGENADPLFLWLQKQKKGILGSEKIKWNFTKFLIDQSGNVVDRFAPQTKPSEIAKDIEKLLG